MQRVFLETFGCQMNILDSELVSGQFKAEGFSIVDNINDASVVLLNTCSVRKVSENKALSILGRLRERKESGENLVVGVLGCMAERSNDELSKNRPFIDVMVGPSKIHDTLGLVKEALAKTKKAPTKKVYLILLIEKVLLKLLSFRHLMILKPLIACVQLMKEPHLGRLMCA